MVGAARPRPDPIVAESGPRGERPGGEGGIRTHGAFAHRFSRAAPSTTRTPLRARGYPRSTHGSRVELFDLVAADATDDPDPAPERGMLRELEHGAGGAVRAVRDGEHELLDVRREQ